MTARLRCRKPGLLKRIRGPSHAHQTPPWITTLHPPAHLSQASHSSCRRGRSRCAPARAGADGIARRCRSAARTDARILSGRNLRVVIRERGSGAPIAGERHPNLGAVGGGSGTLLCAVLRGLLWGGAELSIAWERGALRGERGERRERETQSLQTAYRNNILNGSILRWIGPSLISKEGIQVITHSLRQRNSGVR